MQVNVIVFGNLVDITGSSYLTLTNIADTDTLLKTLHHSYPALTMTKYMVAVERQVINANTILQDNHTVALMPPFSGG